MPERLERWFARTAGDFVGSAWFDGIARFGYGSKGAVFGVVGVLALLRATGGRNDAEDTPGAIERLQDLPLHEALLVLLALGLTGYAAWRVVQAVLDAEGDGRGWKGLAKRSAYLGIGAFYGYLAYFSIGVIAGLRAEDNGVEDFTATVLGWPGGRILVGLAGVGVILSGLNEVIFALRGRYRSEFDPDSMPRWERLAMTGVGWWGHVGRGLVYGLIGYLVIRAAVNFDPDEAAGLAEAFQALEEQPYGSILLGLAGAAFLAFGFYCVFLAVRGDIANEEAVHGSLEET
jgi:hypothetical protein